MPSDYIDGLDSYQAFQLDVALAMKYDLTEQDERLDMLETIVFGIENLIRVQGGKIAKRKPRQHIVQEKQGDRDELPLLDDILASIGGDGNVIVKGSELPKWQER